MIGRDDPPIDEECYGAASLQRRSSLVLFFGGFIRSVPGRAVSWASPAVSLKVPARTFKLLVRNKYVLK